MTQSASCAQYQTCTTQQTTLGSTHGWVPGQSLPHTGFDIGLVVVGGLVALAAGVFGWRSSRSTS